MSQENFVYSSWSIYSAPAPWDNNSVQFASVDSTFLAKLTISYSFWIINIVVQFTSNSINWQWQLPAISQHAKKYKKVLVRERKRHTTRRISSTPSAGWGGYPIPGQGVGQDRGYPHPGVPILGYPLSRTGVPSRKGSRTSTPPPRCGMTNKLKLLPSPSFGCGR